MLSIFCIACNGQNKQEEEKSVTEKTSHKKAYTEEELISFYQEYRKNQASHRIDDSIRLKNFQNLKSLHNMRENRVETTTPFIDELGKFAFDSQERFLVSEHSKIRKISWEYKGNKYQLDSIGNFYTVVNDQLLVIHSEANEILVFNPKGEQLKTVGAPNLKTSKMIQGRKNPDDDPYNPGKWYIKPAGIPIENSDGEIIGYKTRAGELAAGFSEKIMLDEKEYLMINMLGNQNIEKQFLNLTTYEWLDTGYWIGIL